VAVLGFKRKYIHLLACHQWECIKLTFHNLYLHNYIAYEHDDDVSVDPRIHST